MRMSIAEKWLKGPETSKLLVNISVNPLRHLGCRSCSRTRGNENSPTTRWGESGANIPRKGLKGLTGLQVLAEKAALWSQGPSIFGAFGLK
jgi:hypothetical protein